MLKQSTDDDKSHIYTLNNQLHFVGDVTATSMFELSRELRELAHELQVQAVTFGVPIIPIELHLTTNGGEVFAAFSVVDCIQSLPVPVHSVVEGFVASAGTLISLAAARRIIRPNAYMLIHQLSSGTWGKMNDMEEQVDNLKKLMTHMTQFYLQHTKMTTKALQKLLVTDTTLNAHECLQKGLVDEIA
jgi:ATP-dependent protease ClpP protease subunit